MDYTPHMQSPSLVRTRTIQRAVVLVPLLALGWTLSAQSADGPGGLRVTGQAAKDLDEAQQNAERLINQMVERVRAKHAAVEAAHERMSSARIEADKALAAFAAHSTSVDAVLDAQRRQADAEVEYARAVLDDGDATTNEARRAICVAELEAAKKGRDAATAVWRLATAFKNTGIKGVGPEVEAQAREQHALFVGLGDNAVAEVAKYDARIAYLQGERASRP